MTIAVGLITGDMVRWETTWSLVNAAGAGVVDDFRITTNLGQLDVGRNQLVRWFLDETTCETLLCLDSDMAFMPADILQLAEDDLQCISGVYYNVFEGSIFRPVLKLLPDTPITDDPVMEVAAVGAGFLMLGRDLLETMREEYAEDETQPGAWFWEGRIDGEYTGEDFGFCHRVREVGGHIHIDLRVQLSHYKTVRLTGPEALAQQEENGKKPSGLLLPTAG